MWASLPVLIVAVIAVMAFVRGKWLTPLLLAVFAVWGLWVFVTMGIPALRLNSVRREQRRQERKEEKARKTAEAKEHAARKAAEAELKAAGSNPEVAQALLRHVNHRVSAQLKALYPEARWEWKVKNPTLLAIHGGIGRIRIYGVPDYEYADVELEQSGKLSCSLVKLLAAPVAVESPPPQPPNRQEMDPQVWYELQGRETLEALIADLDSRGHNCLTLKGDGSICIQPMDGEEETVQDTLRGFPEKGCWAKLVKVLEQTGLAATAREDCITVAW